MDGVRSFDRAVSIILAEGEGCYCPHHSTCGYADDPWCRHIERDGDNVRICEYKDLDIAYCVYRERPGCCWLLAAVETLATDCLRKGKINCPPVPSEAITLFDQTRKIELRLVPLKFHHGAVWLVGQDWVIQLNDRETPSERRHTVFREAFHIACRNNSLAFKKIGPEDRPFRELIADHFATCFLMPKEWVEDRWPVVQDVRTMAGIFDVPNSAMRRRLNQLGLKVK